MRTPPLGPDILAAHRRRLEQLLPPRSVAIVHASDVMPTTGDGAFPIHPAADLLWLAGIEQEESVLVLAPDAIDPANRETLFLRQPTEHLATWEGEKLSADAAREISGVRRVRWLADLPGALHALLAESDVVFLNANEHERASIDVDSRDLRLARQLMWRYPLHRYARLAPLFRQLRAVKDDAEVACVRRAIDLTAAGLDRLAAALRPGVMEHDLEAELRGAFTRGGGRVAYEPIVASGRNACVLHYTANDRPCNAGDLVLVDAGASLGNYCADLTRTYPVSGRFTARQRQVYEAVLRVLRLSVAAATAGTTLREWRRTAQSAMAAELEGLGLLTADEVARDSAEAPACQRFFMHGIGHSLGLGVHDLAPQNGPLEPGWVVTVEPGIYIPEEGLGVRLENDILVTAAGPVDLCSAVPIEPDAIESLLAGRRG